MLRRIITTGVLLLWIQLNFTLCPALIAIGWANLGTDDNTFGWWLIAIGSLPILLYFVCIFLDDMIDKTLMIANAGRSTPASATGVLYSLLFVLATFAFCAWLLVFPILGVLGGDDPTCLEQNASDHVSLTCNLLWWPGWFY